MDSGKTHYAFVNKKGEFHMGGYLREDHIQPYYSTFAPKKVEITDATVKPKVSALACGAHLTAVITTDNLIYASGNTFMKVIEFEQNSKFTKIPFDEDYKPVKIHCCKVKTS